MSADIPQPGANPDCSGPIITMGHVFAGQEEPMLYCPRNKTARRIRPSDLASKPFTCEQNCPLKTLQRRPG